MFQADVSGRCFRLEAEACLDIQNVNALKGRRLFQINPNLGFMTWGRAAGLECLQSRLCCCAGLEGLFMCLNDPGVTP